LDLRGVKDKTDLQVNNDDGSLYGCRFLFTLVLLNVYERRFELMPKVYMQSKSDRLINKTFCSITRINP